MIAHYFFKTPLFFCFGLFSLLTGCSGLNSSFTCPTQPGVMCKSLDQVNTMVDQGKIGRTSQTDINSTSIQAATDNTAFINANVLRHPESVMRIWVVPYQDQEGNYYQPGILYSVVKPGQWASDPAVIND